MIARSGLLRDFPDATAQRYRQARWPAQGQRAIGYRLSGDLRSRVQQRPADREYVPALTAVDAPAADAYHATSAMEVLH
jgi:hypothetical protein